MDNLIATLQSVDFSTDLFARSALLLVAGTLLIGVLARALFGRRSSFNHAVSAGIGILFLYALTVVLYSMGMPYRVLIAPLPFVQLVGNQLAIFQFRGAAYTAICSHVLGMVILAFFVNLVDSWLPRGKGLFAWFFFRCLTVALALVMHLLITFLLTKYLPEGLVTYAPTVLLVLLVVLLAVGALKLLVGAVLATVNPLVGALYTFFFATIVGRQLSKAVLTTLLLSLLVYGLNAMGLTIISIASAALVAYVPLLVALAIVWFLVGRVL